MERRFPFWTSKIDHYVNALAGDERERLAYVRAHRQWNGLSNGGLRFLWVGRWVRHKGPERLLAFVASRAVSHPDDLFTVAGTGDAVLPEPLPALVSAGRARLIPRFDRSALAPLLSEHDVGLFTSHVEGWGLVLNEMLEAGLWVFATEAGGVRDLREHFPDRLLTFPPTRGWKPLGPEAPLPEAYSRSCSWDAIATRYLEGIMPLIRRIEER
jgi:glycosyltransferase involved in cell wall biosynthesis